MQKFLFIFVTILTAKSLTNAVDKEINNLSIVYDAENKEEATRISKQFNVLSEYLNNLQNVSSLQKNKLFVFGLHPSFEPVFPSTNLNFTIIENIIASGKQMRSELLFRSEAKLISLTSNEDIYNIFDNIVALRMYEYDEILLNMFVYNNFELILEANFYTDDIFDKIFLLVKYTMKEWEILFGICQSFIDGSVNTTNKMEHHSPEAQSYSNLISHH